MFSTRQFNRLTTTSREIGLSWADKARFLWSYYGSRLPGSLKSGASDTVEVVVRSESKPLRLALRTNGYDFDVVEEIFARRCYDVGLSGVRTILDLGGNIGLASVFFSTAFPDASVGCVEPVPDNIRMIERNIELNGSPVRLFPAAVGPADGHIQMEVSPDPRQSAALAGQTSPGSSSQTICVKVISVPSLLSALGWTWVDVLKIDIEGGERQVLGGRPEWLEKVGAIIGEGHAGHHYTIDTARADLTPFGFTVDLLEQREGAFLFLARRAV